MRDSFHVTMCAGQLPGSDVRGTEESCPDSKNTGNLLPYTVLFGLVFDDLF